MSDRKYTKNEIAWAIGELKRKRPGTEPTEEQAVKLLDTFGKFKSMLEDKINIDSQKNKMKKAD